MVVCNNLKHLKEVNIAICYRLRQYLSDSIPLYVDISGGFENSGAGNLSRFTDDEVQRVHIMVSHHSQSPRFWQLPEGMRAPLIILNL